MSKIIDHVSFCLIRLTLIKMYFTAREECRYVGMSYPTRAEYLDNPATAEIDQSLLGKYT